MRLLTIGGNAPNAAQTLSVILNVPPPSTPVSGAATGVTNNGFTANWSSGSGATGYRLDVSTGSSFASSVAGYQNFDLGNTRTLKCHGIGAEHDVSLSRARVQFWR
jgi:hypothetical protein